MNFAPRHQNFIMGKSLVICRHGRYDPGFEVLNEDGVRQVMMISGSLSVFFDDVVNIYHSTGPRSTQSARIACEFFGERAVYCGILETMKPIQVLREQPGNAIYFTSGEQMNEILPDIVEIAPFTCPDYRATKGKIYAEAIEFIGSEGVCHHHSFEIN